MRAAAMTLVASVLAAGTGRSQAEQQPPRQIPGPPEGVLLDGSYRVRYAPPVTRDEARDLVHRLARAARRASAVLGVKADAPLTVHVHASGDGFSRATGQPRTAGAALVRGHLHVQARALDARGELDRVLVHEMSHLATREVCAGRCPRWLEEGAAVVAAGQFASLRARPGPLPSPAEVSRRLARGVDEAAYHAAGVYASRLTLWPGGLAAALRRAAEGPEGSAEIERAVRGSPPRPAAAEAAKTGTDRQEVSP